MILADGAKPKNIFGAVAVDNTAYVEGVVLSQADTTPATGATIHGRLLAQTAVTRSGATVTQP